MNILEKNLLEGEIDSKEKVDSIFNASESQLLDTNELIIDFEDVSFISVYFLERLENFIQRAKRFNKKIHIVSVQPSIYKVFQVARVKDILESCSS